MRSCFQHRSVGKHIDCIVHSLSSYHHASTTTVLLADNNNNDLSSWLLHSSTRTTEDKTALHPSSSS